MTTSNTRSARNCSASGADSGEQAFIRHDDIAVGDWLDGAFLSDAHGPVVAIERYRCSAQCRNCRGGGCAERAGWRYIVLRDRTEITITPGGLWPVAPASGRAA